jgi:hypothetical protein
MTPFTGDVSRLVERVHSIAGAAVDELSIDLPPRVIGKTDGAARVWFAPPVGTAIMIVSDLGRAAHLRNRVVARLEWLALLRRMQSAGFDPVVIVPGRRAGYADVDLSLRRTLLLEWDRSARITQVVQFRRGRR